MPGLVEVRLRAASNAKLITNYEHKIEVENRAGRNERDCFANLPSFDRLPLELGLGARLPPSQNAMVLLGVHVHGLLRHFETQWHA